MNTTAKNTKANADAPAVRELGADLSEAVRALEIAYRMIQRRYPDAPDVTIVVKRDERAWGHTTVQQVWAPAGQDAADRYEIMISGENLRRGAEHVAATLLHEAAHARNLAAGVRDCDVNGRHNTRFRDQAQSMGLSVAQYGWHGWTDTRLDADGAASWVRLIARLDKGLSASAVAQPHRAPAASSGGAEAEGGPTPVAPPKRTGRRNLHKAVCACGHSLRVSATVLELAAPTCQVCGEPFLAVD